MSYCGMKMVWRLLFLEAVLLVLSGIGGNFLIGYIGENPAIAVSQLHLLIPVLFGGICLRKTHGYNSVSKNLGFRSFDCRTVFLIILLPAAATGCMSFLLSPIIYILTRIFGETVGITAPETIKDFLWIFLSVCVLAPFLEEILFRGVFMKLLDPYGSGIAIAISAFTFALIHFSPSSFPVILILGVILGFIKIYTDSIFPCMLFHSLYNMQSVIVLVMEKEIEKHIFLLAISNIVLTVLFPILLVIGYKMFGKGKWYRGTTRNFKGGKISLILTLIMFGIFSVSAFFSANPGVMDNIMNYINGEEITEYIPEEEYYGNPFEDDGYYYEEYPYEMNPDEFFNYFFGN